MAFTARLRLHTIPVRSTQIMRAYPLTAAAFAPFGQIIEAMGNASAANQGRAQRFDAPLDMACPDNGADENGMARSMRLHTAIYRIGQSVLPFELKIIERHPLSPQLFFPNSRARFLVCACPARDDGEPDTGALRAFVGQRTQGIVWRAGVWHSPFAALDADGDFLMQQWQCGGAEDCEERTLDSAIFVEG